MPEVHGLNVRRVVAIRFVAYAALLGMMTGLGLFFSAGVRGTGSWGWFALATVIGMSTVAWGVRWAFRASAGGEGGRESLALGSKTATGEGSADAVGSAEQRAEPQDVDYLTALRHELRTPLNAVLGFSDVLLSGIDGKVNDSQREDLEIIRGSGIRLRILLDSALDLSQIGAGGLRVDAEYTDLRELVSRVELEAVQLWSNKRVAQSTLPEGPCVMAVDEARLRRSILILADFLASNHRDANIALGLSISHDHLAIEIAAHGSNSPAIDALPTLDETFASEDPIAIRRWPVAVASEIIRCHEGSLYLGDAPSRFLIRLPLQGAR
ncbi:MAG: HAMP domain-containing sensor histidine kinase [Polyangiales bacterium]|jgi:K+-sensing histidine kinase KdpD